MLVASASIEFRYLTGTFQLSETSITVDGHLASQKKCVAIKKTKGLATFEELVLGTMLSKTFKLVGDKAKSLREALRSDKKSNWRNALFGDPTLPQRLVKTTPAYEGSLATASLDPEFVTSIRIFIGERDISDDKNQIEAIAQGLGYCAEAREDVPLVVKFLDQHLSVFDIQKCEIAMGNSLGRKIKIDPKEGCVEATTIVPRYEAEAFLEGADFSYLERKFGKFIAWIDNPIPDNPTAEAFSEELSNCSTALEKFVVVRAYFRAIAAQNAHIMFKDVLDERCLQRAIVILESILHSPLLIEKAKELTKVTLFPNESDRLWDLNNGLLDLYSGSFLYREGISAHTIFGCSSEKWFSLSAPAVGEVLTIFSSRPVDTIKKLAIVEEKEVLVFVDTNDKLGEALPVILHRSNPLSAKLDTLSLLTTLLTIRIHAEPASKLSRIKKLRRNAFKLKDWTAALSLSLELKALDPCECGGAYTTVESGEVFFKKLPLLAEDQSLGVNPKGIEPCDQTSTAKVPKNDTETEIYTVQVPVSMEVEQSYTVHVPGGSQVKEQYSVQVPRIVTEEVAYTVEDLKTVTEVDFYAVEVPGFWHKLRRYINKEVLRTRYLAPYTVQVPVCIGQPFLCTLLEHGYNVIVVNHIKSGAKYNQPGLLATLDVEYRYIDHLPFALYLDVIWIDSRASVPLPLASIKWVNVGNETLPLMTAYSRSNKRLEVIWNMSMIDKVPLVSTRGKLIPADLRKCQNWKEYLDAIAFFVDRLFSGMSSIGDSIDWEK